jgi:hypothetical protein
VNCQDSTVGEKSRSCNALANSTAGNTHSRSSADAPGQIDGSNRLLVIRKIGQPADEVSVQTGSLEVHILPQGYDSEPVPYKGSAQAASGGSS